jgi:hypothetical protein
MPAEPNPGAVGGLIALGLLASLTAAPDTLIYRGGIYRGGPRFCIKVQEKRVTLPVIAMIRSHFAWFLALSNTYHEV